jgi:hypothetical protein
MADFDPYNLPGDAPNPYAPPRADLAPGKMFLPGGMVVEPFSVGAVWRMAWAIFKERWGLVIGIMIGLYAIVYAVMLGLVFLGSLAGMGDQGQGNAALSLILPIVVLVGLVGFVLWLVAGQTVAMLKIARGERASFADLFAGGPYMWSIFFGGLLLVLCTWGATFAVMLPIGLIAVLVGQANRDAVLPILGIGYLLMILVALFVSARLSSYQFAVVDRGLGGLAAIRYSYKITEGHTVSLIGFMIVAALVAVSGVLACGVGTIATGPLAMLMYPCAYLILANQPKVAGSIDRGSDLAEL